ncbi:cytochrome c-type biogenesis protein [Amycolatopsis aidingensis]|uniref:cytochrome c-type biogenesis protein n=1 Tax=Amycolatopsis aidingensis TaxID=2842453 RepID=UPI001C0BB8DE|nr:cytochrome c-type biogenesis protein [Amycolatopsis aidingensis]
MRSRLVYGGTALAVLALLGAAVAGLLTGGPGARDRVYELEQRLRCPVCQSVSVAESPSESAEAMRAVVAEQVAAGRSDQQIIDYFRARYGDWVLLDPPASGATLPLWLLPAGALAGGAVVLFLRRRRPEPDDELTPAQREHVAHALDRARTRIENEEGER